jgi:hypothetical protein
MAATRHPVPVRRSLPARSEPIATAVVRRALPVVAASASVVVATLAAERALATLALRAVDRLGLARAVAPGGQASGPLRATVTEWTIIERISRRG